MKRLVGDETIFDRFFQKVRITPGCWIWTASKRRFGYGQIKYRGTIIPAHRVSYMLHRGEIPDGMFVCHICDTPECVNPDHLFLGTAMDNSQDMVNKGRWANVPFKGSENGNSKLSEEQVISIFFDSRTYSEISAEYRLSENHISRIKSGSSWGHLGLISRIGDRVPRKSNSGYKGVTFHKSSGKWMAQIIVVGKKKHIGLFLTPEDAAVAYQNFFIEQNNNNYEAD